MARPKKQPGEHRESLHATLAPGLKGRLAALQARTGLDMSLIVERALLRTLPAYEEDPGEILREAPLRTSAGES